MEAMAPILRVDPLGVSAVEGVAARIPYLGLDNFVA